MSSNNESELKADQEWDEAYFSLIVELRTKNSQRYLEQTELLLRKKSFEFELDGYVIKYTLDRTGCWFDATNSDKGIGQKSWNRFGWGKKAKRKALPDFFAKTEADILMPEIGAQMASNFFLHLTTKQAWEDALKVGSYSLSTKGKTLEEVGFIHGSFADQVEEVAGFVFAGSTEDLVLLHLDMEKLASNGIEVRVEEARNGKSYPHIYGAIPCDLVDRVSEAHMSTENKLIIN